jgi:hypothetical protein
MRKGEVILLCLIITMILPSINACNKKDRVRSTRTEMLVFNASPNAGKLQVLQNLLPIGNTEYDYVRGLTPGILLYQTVDSGFNNYKVRKGSTDYANILLSNFSNTTSFWVYDTLPVVHTLLIDDNLDTPGITKAKIRVLHLAPDVDTFHLLINNAAVQTSGGVPVDWIYYSSQQLVNQSGLAGFFTVDSGNFALVLRRKNPQTVLKSYNLRFEGNNVYSLVLKGYKDRAGVDSLSLSAIKHY